MIAVIFEALPSAAGREEYLARAAALHAALQDMDGFLGLERFESLSTPGKLLSLSFWRDEAAVAGWRGHAGHRGAQAAGRGGVFADYRLRVARVLRDYGMQDRAEAPDGAGPCPLTCPDMQAHGLAGTASCCP
ncbi:Antibiotic biosynthesis monooxygenase [Paracidovorax avenae ATCC 19860]|uniref:Antibiotic biosynthesis monooxygenase n=1 Tax=Paracidovorax avenae (strain ATCC 19860 / DSM 7227 / CCUG 15838 / JCM 20985 / LMG 2117 / NCPPB 1011) TaxID=643561 RepID=F0Q6L8_PARA1|nr:antibiotic biosynthesis monooxygenase [Paracidovorax avenae]ADX46964.1 Antibiotic biosynthesis monooxygenase [Paracidovorax avenae ATCC 19860]AVS66825.1 antibiotic biosynthesis monooxygenase [Paracidovorax avenae]